MHPARPNDDAMISGQPMVEPLLCAYAGGEVGGVEGAA